MISAEMRSGRFKMTIMHLVPMKIQIQIQLLLLLVVFIDAISAAPVDGWRDWMKVACGLDLCNIASHYCDRVMGQCTPCAPLCADMASQSVCQTHCEGYLVSQDCKEKQSLISAVSCPSAASTLGTTTPLATPVGTPPRDYRNEVIGVMTLVVLGLIAGNVYQYIRHIKDKETVQKAHKSIEATTTSDPAAQLLLRVEPPPTTLSPVLPPPPASVEVTSVPRAGHNPTDSAGMSLTNDSGYPSLNTGPPSLEGSISARPDQ